MAIRPKEPVDGGVICPNCQQPRPHWLTDLIWPEDSEAEQPERLQLMCDTCNKLFWISMEELD